jgi:5-methylcytosine-specific restriction endonuclease McrA
MSVHHAVTHQGYAGPSDTRRTVNLPVLVLNQNYEPLNVTRARRAVVMVAMGNAEMLEDGNGVIRSAHAALEIPSVIRLPRLVKRPRLERKMSRHQVFIRDDFTCQYCGVKNHDVTIDHVVPRSQRGSHTWENLVCACGRCNRRKAGRTPQQAGMKLLRQPFRPVVKYGGFVPYHYRELNPAWRKYLFA